MSVISNIDSPPSLSLSYDYSVLTYFEHFPRFHILVITKATSRGREQLLKRQRLLFHGN